MMPQTGLSRALKRFPPWLSQPVKDDPAVRETRGVLRDLGINTVCQSAHCPNIHDCFSRKKCTFLILGRYCTRACSFCSVGSRNRREKLSLPDKEELFRIQEAVKKLNARKVIITSVTRDDLPDGGAGHFADCIGILRGLDAKVETEVLVPDFLGDKNSAQKIVFAKPDIFSHNIETVPRLYSKARPQAGYKRSLDLIKYVKELDKNLLTKSGLMVGLGEHRSEVYEVMEDLREAGCDIITIGQYLKPDSRCLEVEEFLEPEEFDIFSKRAREIGFREVNCRPFARSSS